MAASGDSCPRCREGRLAVASSQRSGEYQTRYLRCTRCGNTDKQIVKAVEIRRTKSFTAEPT
jgi:DNA-directed RNA polymerase subunit M/transcription elongation factor TFIIS